MKFLVKGLIAVLALWLGAAYAGQIDPELIVRMNAADSPNQKFAVEFMMVQQANALELDPSLGSLPKPERRARVGRVLMDFAEASQRDLLTYLAAKEAERKVEGTVSLWIINEVGCLATRDVIYEVAARSDVDYAFYGVAPVEMGILTPKPVTVPTDAIEPNMKQTNVRGAWKQGYTGQNVVVGVIDTGVWYTHLDLRNHLWNSTVYPNHGFNYASNQLYPGAVNPSTYDTLTPMDFYGHGTHCAGLVSADGSYGQHSGGPARDTMGVAPSAKIMCLPVLIYFNGGGETLMEQSMLLAYQFCIRPPRDTLNGADVITMSLGIFYSYSPRRWSFRNAEKNLMHAGIPHVVAAGNEGPTPRSLRCPGDCPPPWPNPANNPTSHDSSAVITVGSVDTTDIASSWTSIGPSDWGGVQGYNDYIYPPGLTDPDVCYPGAFYGANYDGLWSTYWNGDMAYYQMCGTSMATPGTAGVVALMLSKNPNLSPRQVDSILECHAVVDLGAVGKDNTYGAGRINCSLAVAFTPPPITNDVGVKNLLAPSGTIDTGTTVAPACSVHNYGAATVSYPVRMRIGSFYNQTVQVSSHPSYTSRYVTFPGFTDWPRGTHAITCSTEMTPDERRNNDRALGSVTVQVMDVGCRLILGPSGTLDSGAVRTPACSVYNYGSVAADYAVRMKIGTQYAQTASVTSHGPLTSRYVTFPDWTALERGGLAVSCSTEYALDRNPADDKQTGSVFMEVRDVGTTSLLAPIGAFDSGAVVTPSAVVHNWGNTAQAFDIELTIDDGYARSITRTVGPGGDSTFTFPDWTALMRGGHALKCSTKLGTDMIPDNDQATGSLDIQVRDAGVVEIVAPLGNIPPGPTAPRAKVHNYGTLREPLTVTFTIDNPSVYSRTFVFGNGLPLGVDTLISFPNWNASAGGHVARCSTYLPNDQVSANDVLAQAFTCGQMDVAVTGIVAPTGSLTPGYVKPQARFKNLGDGAASFPASFDIFKAGASVYTDTQQIDNLGPGLETVVEFDSVAVDTGAYATKARHYFADANPANDSALGSFTVTSGGGGGGGWIQKADVPTGPKGKRVKDGGSLAYAEAGTGGQGLGAGDAAGGYIYALKGNNTGEFFKYNTSDNSWAQKESIPAVGSSGKKKMVKKGASLADAAGKRYATKGNNTLEFWEYTPGAVGVWTQKADVPMGAKNVKEGTGAVSVTLGETTYVYFLKGSGTQEFYRHNTLSNTWEPKVSAPAGLSGKSFKNGSCLAFDGSNTIYAVKGSYNEFFAYNVDSNVWVTRNTLPLIGSSGRKKKVKDGAGIAYLGTLVYALKGGNTQEFWAYNPAGDAWTQKEDVPLGGGKKVKGGGALVTGGGLLYALKGNNTLEFYQYQPAACGAQPTAGSNTMTRSPAPLPSYFLRVAPNPFSGQTEVSYSLPRAGNVSLTLYDVTGTLVTTLTSGYHNAGASSFIVYRSSFARGIYILKLETGNSATTQKLIVE
jgi:subtilisin family serine protease